MNEQEIISMDPGEELLLITNMNGAKAKKVQYFEHPELSMRSAIPYKAKATHKSSRSKIVKNTIQIPEAKGGQKPINLNDFA